MRRTINSASLNNIHTYSLQKCDIMAVPRYPTAKVLGKVRWTLHDGHKVESINATSMTRTGVEKVPLSSAGSDIWPNAVKQASSLELDCSSAPWHSATN